MNFDQFAFWSLNFQNYFHNPSTLVSLGQMIMTSVLLTFFVKFEHLHGTWYAIEGQNRKLLNSWGTWAIHGTPKPHTHSPTAAT